SSIVPPLRGLDCRTVRFRNLRLRVALILLRFEVWGVHATVHALLLRQLQQSRIEVTYLLLGNCALEERNRPAADKRHHRGNRLRLERLREAGVRFDVDLREEHPTTLFA